MRTKRPATASERLLAGNRVSMYVVLAMLAGAAVLAVLVLGADKPHAGEKPTEDRNLVEVTKRLDDGRTVHCLTWVANGGRGGIDCDWNGARP